MVVLKPRTVSELRIIQSKLKSLKSNLVNIDVMAAQKAAEETILKKIHQKMKANNFSKKIIENTKVGPIIFNQNDTILKISIISDYTADNGFDVSKAREEGTADHFITPEQKESLFWNNKNTNQPRFSQGHEVSGMKRLLIIETALLTEKQKFIDTYQTIKAKNVQMILV